MCLAGSFSFGRCEQTKTLALRRLAAPCDTDLFRVPRESSTQRTAWGVKLPSGRTILSEP